MMIERLNALKQRKHEFKANHRLLLAELRGNPQFAIEVKELALYFLAKIPTNCSSCLSDFFIELVNLNTNELNIPQRSFVLKRGALIRLNNNIYSFKNINDDVAIRHLTEYPNDIKLFQLYPDNWSELIDMAKTRKVDGVQTELF